MRPLYQTLFTLTTLVLLSVSTLSAQKVEFGFKGGLNLSTLSIDNNDAPDNRIKPGINLGIVGKYNFNKTFFLQTGVALSTKGAKIKGEAPLGFPKGTVLAGETPVLKSNQVYVQIPIQLGYNVYLNSGTKLIVNAGPYVAYGLAGKTQLSASILYGDMIDNTPMEEKTFSDRGLQKLDYGLAAGVGINVGEVILGLNYELGLRNIGPTNGAYLPFYNNSYKNRNLFLTVEFRL